MKETWKQQQQEYHFFDSQYNNNTVFFVIFFCLDFRVLFKNWAYTHTHTACQNVQVDCFLVVVWWILLLFFIHLRILFVSISLDWLIDWLLDLISKLIWFDWKNKKFFFPACWCNLQLEFDFQSVRLKVVKQEKKIFSLWIRFHCNLIFFFFSWSMMMTCFRVDWQNILVCVCVFYLSTNQPS